MARAVAKRAKPFGLRIIAYDPFIEELVWSEHGVVPGSAGGTPVAVRFRFDACDGDTEAEGLLKEEHFRQMKKTALYISTGRGPTTEKWR